MNQLERMTANATKDLEGKIKGVYSTAKRQVEAKMAKWAERFKTRDAEMRAKLTDDEYKKWLQTQVYVGKQWTAKAEDIADTLVNADRDAARIINHSVRNVFAESANYALYELEKGMGVVGNFALYDSTTVDRLLRDTPELLPRRNINGDIDNAWQTKQIANAVTQGIIQGEGIPQISKRVAEQTGVKAEDTTTRYARTAMTSAQNAGRQERMEEVEDDLEEQGIETQKMWVCTLDDRTRDAHQELDGVTIGVKEHFHNSIGFIDFPGDPNADDENVWNCRCTLEYVYPQFPRERQRRAYRINKDGKRESYVVGDVTYKEWKEGMTEAAQVETPQVETTPQVDPASIEGIKERIENHTGDWTIDELSGIGGDVQTNIEERASATMEQNNARIAELKAQREDVCDRMDAKNAEYVEALKAEDLTKAHEIRLEKEQLEQQHWDMGKEIRKLERSETSVRIQATQDVLAEIRPMGGITADNVNEFADFHGYNYKVKQTREKAIEAMNSYPTSWLEKSKADGTTLYPHWTEGRAYYSPSDGEIRFSWDKSTNVHELGHRFERTVPGILQAEKDLYESRTAGESLEWLGRGYRRDEKTRRDSWIHAYMGKDYGGSAYEIVSMGFQYALTDPKMLDIDKGFAKWVYGVLASF